MLLDRNLSNTTDASDPSFIKVTFWIQIGWLVFILFVGTIMNSVILLVTYLDSRLHNADKYFVACLAVSDLLSVIMKAAFVYQEFHIPRYIAFCFGFIWGDIVIENSSIMILIIISIDRYLKITKPFKYKVQMTTNKARNIIISLWFYSTVIASVGVIRYPGYKGVYVTSGVCTNDNPTFYITLTFALFFLPVIFLIIMCILMFLVVKRFNRRDQNIGAMRVHRTVNSNLRAVGIYTLVVCTFIVCWGPIFMLIILRFIYNLSLIHIS